MIALKRVGLAINGRKILSNVSLRIDPKECMCVVGGGGSGKTTLLRLLVKDLDPTSGSIDVDGVPLESLPPIILQLLRSRTGILFQEPRLLEHATVRENIAYPLEVRGTAPGIIERRTAELSKRLGLTKILDAYPRELSHSERLLTAAARAFANSPLIVLADEPVQSLDETQAQAVLSLLREAVQQGSTVIVFTSNTAVADALDARTVTLEGGTINEQVKGTAMGKAIARHRILDTDDVATDEPDEPAVKTPGRKDGRKVKITAINS